MDAHFATWTQAGDAGSDRNVVTASLLRVGADATAAGDLGGAIFIAELRPDKFAEKSAEGRVPRRALRRARGLPHTKQVSKTKMR